MMMIAHCNHHKCMVMVMVAVFVVMAVTSEEVDESSL